MQHLTEKKDAQFVERRSSDRGNSNGTERRQFRDGNRSSNPEVAELADAIDHYKLVHRRRFITFDELFDVITGLGYTKLP